MDDCDWLKDYTTKDRNRWTDTPFSLTVDGEPWSGATTGHMAVLVSQGSDAPAIPRVNAEFLAHVADGERHETDYPPFRAWCLDLPPATSCEDCDGEGKVNDCATCGGSGECECECGDVHDCPDCDGTGDGTGEPKLKICGSCHGTSEVRARDAGYARLYGIPVDRVQLSVLAHLTAERVTIVIPTGPHAPVRILAPDWRVIVAPLHSAAKTVSAWPGLEVVA